MNLKILTSTSIFGITSGASIVSYHSFQNKSIEQKEVKDERKIIAENIRESDKKVLFCFIWKDGDKNGSFQIDCDNLLKDFSNNLSEKLNGKKTLQKLKIREKNFNDVLIWHDLWSKENLSPKSIQDKNWKHGEWECYSEINSENSSEIFVGCFSNKN